MINLSLHNLLGRPIRSSLAILGMTIAILTYVGLFSVSAGINSVVNSTLNRVPGLIAMQRGAPIPLFSTLPRQWIEEIETMPGVYAAYTECWSRVNVVDSEVVINPPRLLCGTDIKRRLALRTSVVRDDVKEGRFLDETDVNTFNTVISKPIAQQYKKKVGDQMEVNGQLMHIVGIYETGSLLLDVCIYIDQNSFRTITSFDADSVSSFYIEQHEGIKDKALEELAVTISDKFRNRQLKAKSTNLVSDIVTGKNPLTAAFSALDRSFKSKPYTAKLNSTSSSVLTSASILSSNTTKKTPTKMQVDDGPLEIKPAMMWAGRFDNLTGELNIFLGLLTAFGLAIAVVCILNTMLMSVMERITEFGILRANGWSRLDLLKLISYESGMMGLTGGILGSICGLIGTFIFNQIFVDRVQLVCSPTLMITGIVLSTVMGIIGGLYPALWVTRMSPMEAIRRG
jgi:putative ABC transport system permease protein